MTPLRLLSGGQGAAHLQNLCLDLGALCHVFVLCGQVACMPRMETAANLRDQAALAMPCSCQTTHLY